MQAEAHPDMNTTFAPSPWPAPRSGRREPGWRFARETAAQAGRGGGWRFELKRNVSMSPRQLLLSYAVLCAVSLAVATGFWWQGVGAVMVFTGIELVAAGVALFFVARHAGDRELIILADRELAVEHHCGAHVDRASFRAEWVRVEPAGADGSLVELSGQGRSVKVGRHVRPELRVELADELRRALSLARTAGEHDLDHGHQA